MRCSSLAFVGFGLVCVLLPKSAAANGQSTHLWISEHALTHVPEGPLREFLTRPDLRAMLDNGTMFPDGGYPLDDPYAEIAHWEPFQVLLLQQVIEQHDPPYADEGAEQLAFLLGMASHGMADQVFDSLYGERVKLYDGDFGDFDTASDLLMMAEVGPRTPPSDTVPYALLDQLYDQYGYDVDPARMMQGQNLLRIAVNSVGLLSQMPDLVEEEAAPFPWGREHLLDLAVPGSPPCEGEIVARYWRVLWALAHEQALPGPVIATIPPDGGSNHPIDSSTLESWVSVVFVRGLEDAPLSPAQFVLEPDAGGEAIPLTLWHYYGQDAHVVHLRPQVDLAPDTIYVVRVEPGVQTIHGEQLEGYEFRFSTGEQAPEPTVPEWPPDHDPSPDPGDGDGDTDTGTDSDGGSESESETGTGTDSDVGDEIGSEGETGTAASSDEAGCSCSADARPRGLLGSSLALLLLGLRRRGS